MARAVPLNLTLYGHLDKVSDSIRLLNILPAKFTTSPILCRLSIISLNSDPPPSFEALSYVWGSPDFTETVLIDGHERKITKSLDQALRRLRKKWRSRVIWIDQVCINQDDLAERSSQVLLMGKIYSTARRVVAWLGEPTSPGSERVLRWACHWLVGLYHNKNFASLYLTSPNWSTRSVLKKFIHLAMMCIPVEVIRMHLKAKEYRLMKQINGALSRFDKHPYWTRMWILQEFSLAHRLPVLIYGSTILADEFLKASFWGRYNLGLLDRMARPLEEGFKMGSRHLSTEEILDAQKEIQSMKEQMNPMNGFGSGLHLSIRNVRQSRNGTLSWLLINTYGLQSGDPRDKVYALYSMVQQRYDLPAPDYTAPVDVIARDVVIRAISVDKTMTIYDWLAPSPGEPYPSWTPNMKDAQQCFEHWWYCMERIFDFMPTAPKASGNYVADVIFEDERKILNANGLDIDIVDNLFDMPANCGLEKCCEMTWRCAEAVRRTSGSWKSTAATGEMTATVANESISVQKPCKLMVLLCELWEVVEVLDPRSAAIPPNQQSAPITQLMANYILSNNGDATIKSKITRVRQQCDNLEGSTLFCTAKGFVGFAYSRQQVRRGDQLVILCGANFPYILRPVGSGCYNMVGSVYVSGVMDAQLVEQHSAHGAQAFQRFRIK